MQTLILPQEDIHAIINHFGPDHIMDELIDQLHESVVSFDPSKTKIPIRSGFNYSKPQSGLVEWMPLYHDQSDIILKLVGYHPENPNKFGLPTILSNISAYDTNTGHLRIIMDGVLPTSLRTGAASAVASKLMAKPDSKTLGLIGLGAQAITQLHEISRTFAIDKVLIYDIDDETTLSFKRRCESLQLSVEIIQKSKEEILRDADILCTATSIAPKEGPLFNNEKVKDHLHVNAVGADFPGKIEIPKKLLRSSFVCPDFRDQAVVEGECQQLEPQEIGEDWTILANDRKKYEYLTEINTVFDSTGWALEDAIVLQLFEKYARELSLGKEIQIEASVGDAKNPYEFLDQEMLISANIQSL